jgi:hypothetical protein
VIYLLVVVFLMAPVVVVMVIYARELRWDLRGEVNPGWRTLAGCSVAKLRERAR